MGDRPIDVRAKIRLTEGVHVRVLVYAGERGHSRAHVGELLARPEEAAEIMRRLNDGGRLTLEQAHDEAELRFHGLVTAGWDAVDSDGKPISVLWPYDLDSVTDGWHTSAGGQQG